MVYIFIGTLKKKHYGKILFLTAIALESNTYIYTNRVNQLCSYRKCCNLFFEILKKYIYKSIILFDHNIFQICQDGSYKSVVGGSSFGGLSLLGLGALLTETKVYLKFIFASK